MRSTTMKLRAVHLMKARSLKMRRFLVVVLLLLNALTAYAQEEKLGKEDKEPTDAAPDTLAPTPAVAPDFNPTDAPAPVETPRPTSMPTPDPTVEDTPEQTAEPTPEPTFEPTPEPTMEETPEPTPEPTVADTPDPTPEPTMEDTPDPTPEPTVENTPDPTPEPTLQPTIEPTPEPTLRPTIEPTPDTVSDVTEEPTAKPSVAQTREPTFSPTLSPTISPTMDITMPQTEATTNSPSVAATASPTIIPTPAPTLSPTPNNVPKTLSPTPLPQSPEPSAMATTTAPTDLFVGFDTTRVPTFADTLSETDASTTSATTFPTLSPTASVESITSSPTSFPTEVPGLIPVEGTVGVIVYFVTSKMSDESSVVFHAASESFLSEKLAEFEQPVFDVKVLDVTGNVQSRDGFATSADEYNLSRLLRSLFNVHSKDFVTRLVESGDTHFATVTQVQSVEAVDGPMTQSEGEGNNGLSGGAIAGIVLGGIAIMCLLFAAGRHVVKSRKTKGALKIDTKRTWSPRKRKRERKEANEKSVEVTQEGPVLSGRSSYLSYMEDDSPANDSMQGYSITRSFTDNDSYMNGGYSAYEYGNDNLSYTYSLDPGIDDGTIDAYANVETSWSGENIEVEGGFGHSAVLSAASAAAKEIALAPSVDSPVNASFSTHEIFAPPGRLGIVVDSTQHGPCVVRVNEGSPLEDVVCKGDVIMAIDNVDTSSMRATSVGQVMASTMSKRRQITLKRETQV